MSFFRYLRDNIRFVLLYFVAAAFLSAMALLDARSSMQPGNAAYTAVISFLLFASCLIVDYSIRRRQAKRLAELVNAADKTPILPEPMDFRDEQYTALINSLYTQYMENVRRLEEDFRESKEFMTAWAHEVKTPVTAARLLLEAGLGTGGEESISEEIERISACIEKVLFYSRSDSFSQDYVIAEENLRQLVIENVKKHSALFIRKHINLTIDVPAGLTVYTDRKWLLFIQDQLLSNALKYTGENGAVIVSARQDTRETVLSYTDNGRGIASADIGRIFDKSFTGALGREEGSAATGLGLYLAQKLAHKLDHNISVSSVPGQGTTAEIHFPTLDDYYNLTQM